MGRLDAKGHFSMAAGPKRNRRRRNAAPRRRLRLEQFEPRTLLSSTPVSADHVVSGVEDTAYVFAAKDFPFFDPNDNPPDPLSAVIIATIPTQGTLYVGTVPITAGTTISTADLQAAMFRYAAPPNANGTPYASFTFQVM